MKKNGRFRNMGRHGAFFSTDALFAATILLLLLVISGTLFVKKPNVDNLVNQAEDLATMLSKTKASGLSNQVLQDMQAIVPDSIPSSNVIFIDHAVAEIIGYLWVTNKTSNATALIENITRDFVSPIYNYGVYIDGDELFRRGPISGKDLASAKRLISGLAQSSPTEGFTARARLSGIRNLVHHQYIYFGGFEGQGSSISRLSDSIIPGHSVIENMSLETIAGANFTLEINGNACKDVSPIGKPSEFEIDSTDKELDSDTWNLKQCINYLRNDTLNNFTITFVRYAPGSNINDFYVSGGFIDIRFRNDNITFVSNVTEQQIPAIIKGVPNIRGNIPLKGSLKSMNMTLKYEWNHTAYDHGRLFVIVGNKTVFNDTASIGNQTAVVNTSRFQAMLPVGLANTNLPYYIGVDHFKGFEGEKVNGNVVLALDSSESYDACMVDGYEPAIAKTSCTNPATGADYCCAALADIAQTRCPQEACFRDVRIVDDGYMAWCQDRVEDIPIGKRLLWRFMAVQDQDNNQLKGSVQFASCKILKSKAVSLEDANGDVVTIDGTAHTESDSIALMDPDNPGYNLFQAVYNIFSDDLKDEPSTPQQIDFDLHFTSSLSPDNEEMADFDGFVLELECGDDKDFQVSVDNSDYFYYAGMNNQTVADPAFYSGPAVYTIEQENHLKSNVIRNDSIFFVDELARYKNLNIGVVEATGVGMPAEIDAGEAFSLTVNRRNQNNWMAAYTENCYSWKPLGLGQICAGGTPTANNLVAYNRAGGIISSVGEGPADQYTPGSEIQIPIFQYEQLFYRSKWPQFQNPYGMAIDSSGNIIVADTGNNLIRTITPVGYVSTIAGGNLIAAGTGNCLQYNEITATYINSPLNSNTCFDAAGATAQFKSPSGIVRDSSGNIFVADKDNNRIRMVTPSGVVTTIAGTGLNSFPTANGNALARPVPKPDSVTIDNFGNLYITVEHGVLKITSGSPRMLEIIAGSGTYDVAINGVGILARFNSPKGIGLYNGPSSGNPSDDILYVADYNNNVIRKIELNTLQVSTNAGGWGFGGTCGGVAASNCADGIGSAAEFYLPVGIHVDQISGYTVISDSFNNCVRYMLPDGTVGTVAGLCTIIGANKDGFFTEARFFGPQGIVHDGGNLIYVATGGGSHLIRKVSLYTPPFSVTTLTGGGTGGGTCLGIVSGTCSDSPPVTSPPFGTTSILIQGNSGVTVPLNFGYTWRDDFGYVLPLIATEDGKIIFPAGTTQWAESMIGVYGYPDTAMQSNILPSGVTYGDGAKDLGAVSGFFGAVNSPTPRYEVPPTSNPKVMVWVGGPTDYTKKHTYNPNDHVYVCLNSNYNVNSICDFVEPGFVYIPVSCPSTNSWHHPFNLPGASDPITTYHDSLNHAVIVYDPLQDGIINTLDPVNPLNAAPPNRDTLVNYISNTKSWRFDCLCCALHRAGKMLDPNYDIGNFLAPVTPYPDQHRAVVLVSDGFLTNVSCTPAFDGKIPEYSAYAAAARLSGVFWNSPINLPGYVGPLPGYGARVFVIGVGDRRNDFVLSSIAAGGNGTYYTAENDDQLKDAFVAISNELRNKTRVNQLINNTQALTNASYLYAGSRFELDMNPIEPNVWFGKVPWYINQDINGGCKPSFSLSSKIQGILDASLITYTRYYWLLNASISYIDIYNHSWWQKNINVSGDPSTLWISPQYITLNNSVQEVRLTVGADVPLDPLKTDCSENNHLFSKVMLGTIGNSSPVLPGNNGCTWTIGVENKAPIALKVPKSYAGPLVCSYLPGFGGVPAASYLANESAHVAVANLLSLMDLDDDGDIVEIDFSSIDIDLTQIEKVPYLFGPLQLEVRVWQ